MIVSRELVEVTECDSDTALELEKAKTLEYIERYGEDQVVGYRFTFKKKLYEKQEKESRLDRATLSIIQSCEDIEENLRICEECIHFDNPDLTCTLFDEVTVRFNTCIFWSNGLWGETLDEIRENAIREADSWFNTECAETVRNLFGNRHVLDQIRTKGFPHLAQQKPYTAYMVQKDLVNDFILRSLGIPKGEDEWNEYHELRKEVRN